MIIHALAKYQENQGRNIYNGLQDAVGAQFVVTSIPVSYPGLNYAGIVRASQSINVSATLSPAPPAGALVDYECAIDTDVYPDSRINVLLYGKRFESDPNERNFVTWRATLDAPQLNGFFWERTSTGFRFSPLYGVYTVTVDGNTGASAATVNFEIAGVLYQVVDPRGAEFRNSLNLTFAQAPDAGNVYKEFAMRVVDEWGMTSSRVVIPLAPFVRGVPTPINDGFDVDFSETRDIDHGLESLQWIHAGSQTDITPLGHLQPDGKMRYFWDELIAAIPTLKRGVNQTFTLKATDHGGYSNSAQFVVLAPPLLSIISAITDPGGGLLVAQNTTSAPAGVLASRLHSPGFGISSSTVAGAERPTLVSLLNSGCLSGSYALLAREISSHTWRLWKSSDSRTFTAIATVFSSTKIDYAHLCVTSTSACAIAVVKGATSNTLIFKRTADLANWPPDADALTIQTDVQNVPFIVLVSVQDRHTLIITDAKSFWRVSTDEGRTWTNP